jgi:hypothetical protein
MGKAGRAPVWGLRHGADPFGDRRLEDPATGEILVIAVQRAVDQLQRRLRLRDAPDQVGAMAPQDLAPFRRVGGGDHLDVVEAEADRTCVASPNRDATVPMAMSVLDFMSASSRILGHIGRIVLIGQDWDTFVIDSDDPRLTRALVHARADLTTDPRAARRYRNLLLESGYEDVEVEAYTGIFTDGTMLPMLAGIAQAVLAAGAITTEQHDSWMADQSERARQGRLFLALPLFVASATWNGSVRAG